MGTENKLRGIVTDVEVSTFARWVVNLTVEFYIKDKTEFERIANELVNARDKSMQVVVEVDTDSAIRLGQK